MSLHSSAWPAESADGRERHVAPQPAKVPRAQAWLTGLLSTWQSRALGRSELRSLDARQLRDIGLSEELLAHETTKPFWRA